MVASVFVTPCAWPVGVDEEAVFASGVEAFVAAVVDGTSMVGYEPDSDAHGMSQACSAAEVSAEAARPQVYLAAMTIGTPAVTGTSNVVFPGIAATISAMGWFLVGFFAILYASTGTQVSRPEEGMRGRSPPASACR
ncbi:hypothetical protein [Streptomyces gibsoniae]|uniref:Uncharacterized protein n=1 Tax=Streptomyces gibsoniae TaxID=3075529 RepID=A0ABU2U9H8_9ACTN|nr:hypothetical protein [Streptomyces sp. DSM 41699]MDT0469893.1 hypothetical protein [Streptomyces sp. DSM 41699]